MVWGRSTRRTIWRLAAAGGVCLSGVTACSITTDFDNLAGTADGGRATDHPWSNDGAADGASAHADSGSILGGGSADGGDASPGDDTGDIDAGGREDAAVDATIDVSASDASIDSSKPTDAGTKVDAADTSVVDASEPDTSLPLGSQFAIHSAAKCLEASGTRLVIFACNVTRPQFFQLEDLGGGHFHFIESRSGKCVANTGSSDNTAVQLATCDDGAEQTYQLEDRGNGFEYIVNPNSGKCVQASGGGTSDNAAVQISACASGANQEWKTQ